MEAKFDLKNGDYQVWMTRDEIQLLYDHISINGILSYYNGSVHEIHNISVSLKPKKAVRDLKIDLRLEDRYFFEGSHVMIERQNETHHIVTYIEEELDDLREKLKDDVWHYQENLYDSFNGNKIFIHLQTKQG